MAYIDVEGLKEYMGSTGTGSSGVMATCITAAQKEIERLAHRTFEQETSGTRYYRNDDLLDLPEVGGSGSVLWLGEDCLAVTTLTNGDDTGTAISSTGYWLEPVGRPPYQYIRLKSSESWVFGTDGQIAMSANWGFSSAPDAAIVELTKQLASYLFRMRDNPVYDVTATPELGMITIPKGMVQHVSYVLENGGYIRKVGIL